MIEIPEARVLSGQLNAELAGKMIENARAASSPHKFAWYSGDPAEYGSKLEGRIVKESYNHAARVFLELDNGLALVFGEGTRLRYHMPGEKRPGKHQLLLEFHDDTALSVSIQMYGFIMLEDIASITNKYIVDSIEKPSPLADGFDEDYFIGLFNDHKETSLSAKGFLATEQRIPGLGNGVLNDILFNARIHPRLKLRDFNDEEPYDLFNSIVVTLGEMTHMGGRSSERDIYGNPGGYEPAAGKGTLGKECRACGEEIQKQNYMGGSVYFCPSCQRLD